MWYVVGIHKITNWRTVMPMWFKTREEAEKMLVIAQQLVPPNLKLHVEEGGKECSEN